jgi:hypothetical protein
VSDNELAIKMTADASAVKKATDEAKEHIEKAAESVAMLGDLIGVKVPDGVQKMLANTELIGPALTAAFEPLALLGFIQSVADAAKKLSDLISDTFIFTNAQKEEDKALKSSNEKLAQALIRVKELGRETQIAAEKTAAGKEKLRLQFKLEDLGGDPKALQAKIDRAKAEWKTFAAVVNAPNQFAMHNEVGKAQEKMKELEITIQGYTAALKEAEAQTKKSDQAISADLEEAQRKINDYFAKAIHGRATLADAVKKSNEEAKKDDRDAADALQALWAHAAREATKDYAQMVAAGEKATELAIANAQKAEAQQEADIAHALMQHRITKAQEIQQVADAKVKELELEKQYWQSVQSLLPPYSEKWKEFQKKITEIEKQEIKIRSKAETDAANAEERGYQKVISGMQAEFSSFTSSLIGGHQTITQSWANLVDNMTAKFVEGLERELMQYLAHEAIKQEIDAANHAKSAARNAADAAQRAYKWAADWGGPIAGAISAATAFAGVTAFGSAEGGQWEVPGIQMTMLHPQEMVLPASLAGRMRNVIDNGAGAGGGSVQIHFHVNAIDGQDAANFIGKNSRNIAGAVAKELKKKGFFSK